MPDITTTSIEYPANGVSGAGHLARSGCGGRHPAAKDAWERSLSIFQRVLG